MKKILLLIVIACASILGVDAQEYETPKNEMSVSWGIGTVPHLIVGFSDALSAALAGNNASEKSYGVFSAQYLHNINKRYAVGVVFAAEYVYKEGKDSDKHDEDFFTLMPTARAYWFRGKSFGMYSRVALGVSMNIYEVPSVGKERTQIHSDTHLAYHAAPVAIEVGSNKFAGFLELGYGYQGIVNAGVKFGL